MESVLRLGTAGTFNTTTTPEFAAYADHTPFELTVTKEAIEGGVLSRVVCAAGAAAYVVYGRGVPLAGFVAVVGVYGGVDP